MFLGPRPLSYAFRRILLTLLASNHPGRPVSAGRPRHSRPCHRARWFVRLRVAVEQRELGRQRVGARPCAHAGGEAGAHQPVHFCPARIFLIRFYPPGDPLDSSSSPFSLSSHLKPSAPTPGFATVASESNALVPSTACSSCSSLRSSGEWHHALWSIETRETCSVVHRKLPMTIVPMQIAS
jgi:hypothetical protein